MANPPFGFSADDDPDRDQQKKSNGPGDGNQGGAFGFSEGQFNPADLGQIFSQLGQMFSGVGSVVTGNTSDEPVNYDVAKKIASNSIGFVAPIPVSTSNAIGDAVHLAETWLDGATALPAGTSRAVAWTPHDWVNNTLDTWKRLCNPIAEHISVAWSSALPDDAKTMSGPLVTVITHMGGLAFGSQLGQALGRLSREVLTSTDIGLPLGGKGVAALLPEAIETFSAGLEQPRSEILTFLAAREAAHYRLFGHVPWLSHQLLNAIETYARGMTIDVTSFGELAGQVDPLSLGDSTAMEQLLNQGVFEPKATPEQNLALERLETLLALIEGWVQTVVAAALHDRIPGTAALSETLRRRRATAGPAEQTFSTLVGLELRPRKMREAAALWERLTVAVGIDARDAVWQHPDLMPSSADVDEPAAFIDRIIGGDSSGIDEAFSKAMGFSGGVPGKGSGDFPGDSGKASGDTASSHDTDPHNSGSADSTGGAGSADGTGPADIADDEQQ